MSKKIFDQTISIKPMSDISYTAWFDLWVGYQRFYQCEISKDVSLNTWKKLIAADVSHMYGFAAILDQRVLGIVHVIEHDSCWTIQPYAYLQDVYVNPEFRSQGIARQLIEAVYAHAKSKKCDRVYWLTHESTQKAHILYDKVAKQTGFIQYRMA